MSVRFAHTQVTGLDTAIRSMRMPLQSFDKSDSHWDRDYCDYVDSDGAFHIGKNDLDLAHRLLMGGNDAHSKFLRSIQVYTEITAPMFWLAELDTYKIGTVRNSSSIQHTGAKRDYVPEDFTIDKSDPYAGIGLAESECDLRTIIQIINKWRKKYKDTNDYTYFRVMRELMPAGYNYTISWTANYAVLREIYKQRIRDKHRLEEWSHDFYQFLQTLPYARDLIFYGLEDKK